MGKRLYAEKDIKAHAARGEKVLSIGLTDILTPLAVDTARHLGMEIIRTADQPHPAPQSSLHTEPTNVAGTHTGTHRKIVHVDGRSVRMEPFPFAINRPEMHVRTQDVITSSHGAPIAAGFLTMHKGSFPWTLTYDEIQYIVEGELHIVTRDGTFVGKPGDVLYIPKGSSIEFSTPSWAKFLYVTCPADWAE